MNMVVFVKQGPSQTELWSQMVTADSTDADAAHSPEPRSASGHLLVKRLFAKKPKNKRGGYIG